MKVARARGVSSGGSRAGVLTPPKRKMRVYLTVTLITCWPEITNSAGNNSLS